MGRLLEHWPLAGLAVRTPRLELRVPDEDDLLALVELAVKGIHDPDEMPFTQPWTRREAGGELERSVLQWNWRQRAEWAVERWGLQMVVVVEDQVLGVQDVIAEQFLVRRTVQTGSWLGREHQGQGIGTEMREAILHLSFAGLGAVRAETEAWDDNAASLRVTRKLGYHSNGDDLLVSEDRARRQLRFVMSHEDWERRRRDDIELVGLERCLLMFGL